MGGRYSLEERLGSMDAGELREQVGKGSYCRHVIRHALRILVS